MRLQGFRSDTDLSTKRSEFEVFVGTASPEGSVTADPGDYYLRTSPGQIWIKQTGSGNTGWQEVGGSEFSTAVKTQEFFVDGIDTTTFTGSTSINSAHGIRRLTGSSLKTVEGILNGEDGKQITLYCIDADMVIRHEDLSATASDRIICPRGLDLTISDGGSVSLFYDDTSDRWRVTNYQEKGASKEVFTISDNVSTMTDLTGFVVDEAEVVYAKYLARVTRSTTTEEVAGAFELFLLWDGSEWRLDFTSSSDDSGVEFNITAAGQVQYTSTDLAGASHVGSVETVLVEEIKA